MMHRFEPRTARSTSVAAEALGDEARGVMDQTFTRSSRLPVSAKTVFDWHLRPGALQRLTPPWERVEIIDQHGGIADNGTVTLRMFMGPVPIRWVARHTDYEPGRRFVDQQLKGPFAYWRHEHRVEPDGTDACQLIDEVTYRLPGGALGRWLGGWHVRRKLEAAFAYRHAVTRADVMDLQRREPTPMTIAITGSHGMVGEALVAKLTTAGHQVKRVVRRRAKDDGEIEWSPDEKRIDTAALSGVDGVVHLAGESIQGRWTASKKQRIRESRVNGTQLLANALAECEPKPGVLISASAVGFYGDRGDETLTEESTQGRGFLAELAGEWEAAAAPAAKAGIRVAHPRLGVVLSPAGGALKQMLPMFRMGMGGRIGDGKQWVPWVAIDDVVGAIEHALSDRELSGPFNVTAPEAVTNDTFARTLGGVLGRPSLMPAPAFMLRATFGELADEALLASQRALPRCLQARGYRFRFTDLKAALRHLLGKTDTSTAESA